MGGTQLHIQKLDPRDDLVVALQPLAAGQVVELGSERWSLPGVVPAKQKFAAREFAAGERVTMYGVTVGRALVGIKAGELISRANLEHASDDFTGKTRSYVWTPPDVSGWLGGTFMGYKRATGRSGTANYWVVIPLVFCENRNLAVMREALNRALGYHRTAVYEGYARDLVRAHGAGTDLDGVVLEGVSDVLPVFPGVHGVKFLEHGLGCGGTRQDAEALCDLLAGYIDHPNVAGATVLSLGCQHAQVSLLMEQLGRRNGAFNKPLHVFEQQKAVSERQMLADAMKATVRGVAAASELVREPCPLSDLVVGVECGGSDGFSGISANPVLGHVADVLCGIGASPVLSEFPELCGIEQSLCDRCETPELAERFVQLMRAYEGAAKSCGSGFDSNPSPGNIRDGLITDAIKSAGAAKKGGTGPIVEVCDYPERIKSRGGLVLYCTPGNDVESTTALAAGGCTLMLFTTGLGTPTGNPVCPTLKISTNTELATRMSDIIDFDAGPVIRGERTVAELGEDLMKLSVEVASGVVTPKAVALGQDDFLPWKRGVSL
ncbi:MAG: altronate dehydratase [Verrucomicrobiaceae bacterium]|nr:altronate dehydratase [Verrucomicrobiaceae bacterium]